MRTLPHMLGMKITPRQVYSANSEERFSTALYSVATAIWL